MYRPFNNVVIAGAGVMGAQIAAHFLNIGATVSLLDIKTEGDNPDAAAQKGWSRAVKLNPPILTSKGASQTIRLGNTTDNLDWLKEADLFIEAIPEVVEWKRALYAAAVTYLGPNTVIGSNTSGLKTTMLLEGLPNWFRENFLVIHFFNPPRYMKLLELVAGEDTNREVLNRVAWFAETYWGKGIVEAKDTPDFIGNRIGVFNLMQCIRAYTSGEFTMEEIDLMRGVAIGCEKSGIFRTADLVGLPIVKANADNLFEHLPHDEKRQIFELPEVIDTLIERGSVGAKVREGFYKKVDGKICSLNLETLEYLPPAEKNLPGFREIAKMPLLEDRLRAFYELEGRVGEFFRRITLELLAYCANRIPEIADKPVQVDNAIKWGYGWKRGPFEIWEILGFERICDDITDAGHQLAPWVAELRTSDAPTFYPSRETESSEEVVEFTQKARLLANPVRWAYEQLGFKKPRVIRKTRSKSELLLLEDIKTDQSRVLEQWSGGTLYDIGDSVGLFTFESPANAMGIEVVDSVLAAIDYLEASELKGMVVANSGQNFSVGANLVQVKTILATPVGVEGTIEKFLKRFQLMATRLTLSQKPIVPYVQGLFLGGGAEFVSRCPAQVLHQDAMGGLVEVGVGLIPAGTGTTLMAQRAAALAPNLTPNEVLPYVIKAHERLAMGELGTGAKAAIEMGLAKQQSLIIKKPEMGITAAKQLALALSIDYAAPVSLGQVYCLGEDARTALEHRAYVLKGAGLASEHDVLLANSIASVLTGGPDHKVAGFVPAEKLLELEREIFVQLALTKLSQDRISHMLKTKKPLRN